MSSVQSGMSGHRCWRTGPHPAFGHLLPQAGEGSSSIPSPMRSVGEGARRAGEGLRVSAGGGHRCWRTGPHPALPRHLLPQAERWKIRSWPARGRARRCRRGPSARRPPAWRPSPAGAEIGDAFETPAAGGQPGIVGGEVGRRAEIERQRVDGDAGGVAVLDQHLRRLRRGSRGSASPSCRRHCGTSAWRHGRPSRNSWRRRRSSGWGR